MKVAGLILAGGLSRRMNGREKSLIELNGMTLVERSAALLRPQVDMLAINANGDPARFAMLDLPVLEDDVKGFVGPLAGILTGMRWAALQGATHIATAASDTPFAPPDFVERLSGSPTTTDAIAMAVSGGRIHPVFGLWPTSLAGALRVFLVDEDKRKILEFAKRYPLHEVVFETQPPDDPFFNINTPEDLTAASARLN